MAVRKKGKYYYGETQDDLIVEMKRYSRLNEYPVDQAVHAKCKCGGTFFELFLDDEEGVAQRKCVACDSLHTMADGNEYLADANPEQCICVCENPVFQITVGVSLYEDSDDVRWLYIGCRCRDCDLIGVYGHWANEFIGYQKLFAAV